MSAPFGLETALYEPATRKRKASLETHEVSEALHLPMRRHIFDLWNTRRLEHGGSVYPTGNGAVDGGLLLLCQQRDRLAL